MDYKAYDPQVWEAIANETQRQEKNIELIASENFVSKAVREAQGSILTNKYAEGYPGKRYYGGCEFIDVIENLAINRAKTLFGAEYANVQPHSGSQANMAVYQAFLEDGDTILGMNLTDGGHLTHGSAVNFSGKTYRFIEYGVDLISEKIDYKNLRLTALKEKPKMIVAGASAYSRTIDFAAFREIADEVGAYFMVDMAHIAGLVATGLHPNPVPYADVVTSTTHKTLRGPRGGLILAKEKYGKAINSAIFPGIQGGPLEHVIAGKAIAFKEAMDPSFKTYMEQVVKNAQAMVQVFKDKNIKIISGGTDNHLFLVDVTDFHLTGKDAEEILDRAGITVNKNTIPFEKLSPFKTSGIRIGTPAMTTRGFKEAEATKIAEWIVHALASGGEGETIEKIRTQVYELTEQFPLYQ